MIAPIDEAGLKLLAYLSEHAGGHYQRIWMDPRPVRRSLGISPKQFAMDAANLVALGLAGVRKFASNAESVTPPLCSAIWLTGKGEDYMRALRAVLQAGDKLTAGAVKEL